MANKKDQLIEPTTGYPPPEGDDPVDEPVPDPEPEPQTGETTRVLLTNDNRDVLTERYVPTEGFGFRIFIEGLGHFEHVSEGEGGVWIFAPTR